MVHTNTDGFKTLEGLELGVYNSSQTIGNSFGKEMTIFQFEVLAILKCVNNLIS